MQVEPFSQYSIIFYSITLTAALYVLFSQFVTKKFGNPDRVKQIQQEMTDTNKKYAEALKSKDESKIKKAEADQARIFPLMMESMKYQFTPLLILLPLLWVLPGFLKNQFPVFEVETPVAIPVFIQHFEKFPNWRAEFGTYGWFWVAVVFIGLFAFLLVTLYEKATGKADKKK